MGAIIDKPLIVNTEATAAQKSDKPLKPCCACPETKKIRDEWYVIISTVNILAKIMFEEITAIDKDTVNRSIKTISLYCTDTVVSLTFPCIQNITFLNFCTCRIKIKLTFISKFLNV